MSNPRANRAVAHLLEHLSAAEFTYPGTNLQLVYSIAGHTKAPDSALPKNYLSRKPVNHSIKRSRITTSERISSSSSIDFRSACPNRGRPAWADPTRPISTRCRWNSCLVSGLPGCARSQILI